jgi:hypothetical protein
MMMLGLFKDNKKKKLEREYALLLEKAMHAQRNGDIETYSSLSSKADDILKVIESLEKRNDEKAIRNS